MEVGGEGGGVIEDRQMSGWLCFWDCVTQDTGGEVGVKQGLQRRAREGDGPDMLNLRCQPGIWVDCQEESFPYGSESRGRCGSPSLPQLTLISCSVC